MYPIYATTTLAEAHLLASHLEEAGIRTHVSSEMLSGLQGAIPISPATAPQVCVLNADDLVRARELLQVFLTSQREADGESWTCATCCEASEPAFDVCWNCGTERAGAESTSADGSTEGNSALEVGTPESEDSTGVASTETSSRWEVVEPARRPRLVAEILAVFFLCNGWHVHSFLVGLIWGYSSSWTMDLAYDLFASAFECAHVLAALWLARAAFGFRWTDLGLVRPRWGVVPYALLTLLLIKAVNLLVAALYIGVSGENVLDDVGWPRMRLGVAMLWYALPAVVEELVYRGYLLRRWFALRGSIGEALIVSSVVFGAMHGYQGLHGVIAAAMTGFVLGLFFLLSRSLWVVILAHWFSNVWLELSQP